MSTLRDKPPLPIIFGCYGQDITQGERNFFRYANPLGFILFKRNIANPAQLRLLIEELRASVGRKDAPIFIDQEGGRVQRLGPPHWQRHAAAAPFGNLAAQNMALAEEAVRLQAQNMAQELFTADIQYNCAPCADLYTAQTHAAIGDRAYAAIPQRVARLARVFAETMLAGGVMPVIKHLPGHGRAAVDAHFALPHINTTRAELNESDFAIFRALNDFPLGMVGHLLFTQIDPEFPASLSRRIIEGVVRGDIGFKGLLLSDDLAMQALTGRLEDVARQALAAGIDILLHCSGEMDAMLALAGVLEPMNFETLRAFEAVMRRLPARPSPCPPDLADRLDLLLGLAAAAPAETPPAETSKEHV